MSHELKEGVKLKELVSPVYSDGEQLWLSLGDRPLECSEIVVSEQCGQMGMVPWAKAKRNNGQTVLVNLALMESVTLLEEES